MPSSTPRKYLRRETWVEWRNRVLSDTTQARDLADAIQIAFCRTIFEAVEDSAQVARDSNERPRGTQMDYLLRLAEGIGMSRTTLEETRNGHRWAQLPEVAALAATPALGPVFLRHFGRLVSPWSGVLHSTGDLAVGAPRASNAASLEAMLTQTLERNRNAVPNYEAMARDVIERLAMIQAASARRRLTVVGTTDWRRIRREVSSDPRPITKWGGRNAVLREAGVENLTSLVRSAAAGSEEPFRVRDLHKRVSESYPRLTERQVRDAVRRLKRDGELESPSRGRYAVTDRLRERVTR